MAKKFVIALLFSFLSFIPGKIFAADLSIVPGSGSFKVGDQVVVRIQLNSDVATNAISTEVAFPTSILSLDSVSKTGSILNFWVTEPVISKSEGTIKLEGVALNGFSGGTGTVATITFHAIKDGNGRVSFKSGQVLANDGQGTDITGKLNGASYDFEIPKVVPVTKPVVNEVKKPEVVPEIPQQPPTLKPPEIMEGSKYGEPAIVGVSQYPSSDVLLTFVSEKGIKIFITGKSDESGSFTLLVPKSLKHGNYSVSAVMIQEDQVHSHPSNEIMIVVGNIFSDLDPIFLIALILLILSLIYLIIGSYLHLRKDRNRRSRLNKEVHEAEKVVSKAFDILREDVEGHSHLKGDSSGRVTVKDLKKDIDDAEKVITDEIKGM
jgi:uncharacterized membrane protein